MEKIPGLEIQEHDKSKRILNIKITDEIIKKLVFPFNKFDLTALELKPFTRFTIAKSLDDLTENKLSKLMNAIIRDRSTGCFIIGPKNISASSSSPEIDILAQFKSKLKVSDSHLRRIDELSSKYKKN